GPVAPSGAGWHRRRSPTPIRAPAAAGRSANRTAGQSPRASTGESAERRSSGKGFRRRWHPHLARLRSAWDWTLGKAPTQTKEPTENKPDSDDAVSAIRLGEVAKKKRAAPDGAALASYGTSPAT